MGRLQAPHPSVSMLIYAPFTRGMGRLQVRHPGVTVLMQRDFTLMQRAARLSMMLPFLSDLHLDESIRQFGAPLKVAPCHQLASELFHVPAGSLPSSSAQSWATGGAGG